MANVKMSTELNVSPDTLWEFIGKFNGLPDWHPAVEQSELKDEGSVRTLKLAGGGTIEEKLVSRNDSEREYSYSIIDSPLPIANYTSTIKVRSDADGNKSIVDWSSEFNPSGASESDAMKVVQGIYQAGLDNLKKIYGL